MSTNETNTRSTDYTNDAQQRLVKIILALFSDVIYGFPPSALAAAVGCSRAVMTRDLDNLLTAGLVEKDESSGQWRLTPRLPQQAIKVWTAIDSAEKRVQEAKNRFNRIPD